MTEARMIFDQCKRAQIESRRQGDSVNSGIQRRTQANREGFLRRVHGQLFHAVDEDEAGAALGLHGFADVQTRSLGKLAQIELDQ